MLEIGSRKGTGGGMSENLIKILSHNLDVIKLKLEIAKESMRDPRSRETTVWKNMIKKYEEEEKTTLESLQLAKRLVKKVDLNV